MRLCGNGQKGAQVLRTALPDREFALEALDIHQRDAELGRRGRDPECAVYLVRLADGEVCHALRITGSVAEIYDTAVLAGTRQPLLVGLEGEEISRYVAIGPDRSGPGAAMAAE